MKMGFRLLWLGAWLAAWDAPALAKDTWQTALSRMPLPVPQNGITRLDRTNCVPLMLHAFRSNAVVKALVFLPGATDELYFFRRVHASLTNAAPTLLDAVTALTRQTHIQATFRPPLLLLHTTEDVTNLIVVVNSRSSAAKLRRTPLPGRWLFNDSGWAQVQSALDKKFNVGLRPWAGAPESWHFYRSSFVACGLTEWEMLQTLAWADKTAFTVHWFTVGFRVDNRYGPVPKLNGFREFNQPLKK